MRRTLPILWLTAWLLGPSVASAQPPRREVVLAFDAPSEICMDEVRFRAGVAERLGYDPFVPDSDRTLRIQIEPDETELLVLIETQRAGASEVGLRELDGPIHECERLFDASVLAASIAIDPTVLDRANEPEPEEAEEPEEEGPPPPVPEPVASPVTPEPEPAPRLGGGLYVMVNGSLGTAPSVGSVGAGLGFELRYGAFGAMLGGRLDIPGTSDVDAGSVEGHVIAAELALCGHWKPILLCAVTAGGALRGRGRGFFVDDEAYLGYVAAGVRVGVEFDLTGPLAFRAQLDLLGHLTPSELEVDGLVVWSMPPIGAVLGVGMVLRLDDV
ncbi:MAG: hypothetical protein AAGF12_11240 [Myxococcota bacterium]